MNRCATRCMLIGLALTLPAVTAMAENADANSLLGKPTKLLDQRVGGEDFRPPGGRGGGMQISPDGRWLIYWKPTQPLPEIEGDGREVFMRRMQARMNQPGKIVLHDLKTGKAVNLLGKDKLVTRKQAIALDIAEWISPSASHALITVFNFKGSTPDRPVGDPNGTDLYLVRIGKKPESRKIKIGEKLAIGVCLAGAKQALLAATNEIEGGSVLPTLKLISLEEGGSGDKTYEQRGLPTAAHGSKAIVAVFHPRRPKSNDGGPTDFDDDTQWHPAQLHLVDAETGKTVQRPNIHPKHGDRPTAFFLGKSDRIAYGDTDVVQEPESEPGTGMTQKPAVRVWDMKKKTIVREFRERTLIGPGPTESTLVIAQRDSHFDPETHRMIRKHKSYLADIKTGKTWPITDKTILPLAARGGKLVYSTQKDGKNITCVADIKLPAELQNRLKNNGK
ncbi:MAG: hypothetical protein ACLFTN_06090 [Phycisphaerae bacterium]